MSGLNETLLRLPTNATLADLPSQDLSVDGDAPGSAIIAALQGGQHAGVIVRLGGDRVFVISTQSFFQRMSRQFSREVYLQRPIRIFCNERDPPPLRFRANMPVGEAAGAALSRASGAAYEPVLIEFPDGRLRLLDMHVLLLAQSRLLALARAALIQGEKMVGLGQLAAGVAHEINNPLAFVRNDLALLQRDTRLLVQLLEMHTRASELLAQHAPALHAEIADLSERIDLPYTIDHLQGILARSTEGLKRIGRIVLDLRDFARLDEADYGEIDLQAAIASVASLLAGRADGKGVRIVLKTEPIPPFECYPAKISQVIMNLLNNAIDASKAGDEVTIRCEARGAEVVVRVIDHGCGIAPSLHDRVFDPFFTTKPIGAGTGLGLSTSYGIVCEHGGSIEFETAVGRGTTFTVRLPLGDTFESLERSQTISPLVQ